MLKRSAFIFILGSYATILSTVRVLYDIRLWKEKLHSINNLLWTMQNRYIYFFDKHWEIIDLFIWCKFFISIKNIYNTTQHLDVIANPANVWMIQIKRYLIQLLFIWADLQEFCQFIIFALLLEPFWYLLVTVSLDLAIFGLMLEVQSCHYFYCKLGY